MGKVFTPELVAAGEVPTEFHAHEKAGQLVLNELFPELISTTDPMDAWYRNEILISGMVFGSTALGTANLRSDLDILINYMPTGISKATNYVLTAFRRAEERYHVPIEAQFLYHGALMNPLEHNIDPLFAKHLLKVQEDPKWSRNWPASMLMGPEEALDKDKRRGLAVRYCSGKTRQLARSMVESRGAVDYKAMQRALELPSAIGRKVLPVTTEVADVHTIISGNKPWVLSNLLEQIRTISEDSWYGNSDRAVTAFVQLSALDSEYSELLESAVQGFTTIENYQDWITGNYTEALRMGHTIGYFWTQTLRHRADLQENRLSAQPDVLPALGEEDWEY